MLRVVGCLAILAACVLPVSFARADDAGDAALAQGLQQLLEIATDAYTQAEQEEQQQQDEANAQAMGSDPNAQPQAVTGPVSSYGASDFGYAERDANVIVATCQVQIQNRAAVYFPWFHRDPGQFTAEQGQASFRDHIGGMLRGILAANSAASVQRDLNFHLGLQYDERTQTQDYYDTQVWICFDQVRAQQVGKKK